MKRYVYAARVNPGTVVNKVGKYLNNHIDGAFKIEFTPMECTIWMRMYYQMHDNPGTFEEMIFIINVTSYANKIRINLTEDTSLEKTIGQIILTADKLEDADMVKRKVLDKIRKYIDKEYSDYDFVY